MEACRDENKAEGFHHLSFKIKALFFFFYTYSIDFFFFLLLKIGFTPKTILTVYRVGASRLNCTDPFWIRAFFKQSRAAET